MHRIRSLCYKTSPLTVATRKWRKEAGSVEGPTFKSPTLVANFFQPGSGLNDSTPFKTAPQARK